MASDQNGFEHVSWLRSHAQRPDPEVVVLGRETASRRLQAADPNLSRTEDAQLRAERIFVYSIERVRDPGRVYEVHLMKNLAGFTTRNWRTKFTNYRFAIPDFAGRQGRAIYNDVDEIYLVDPPSCSTGRWARHGYLAVSPMDTSVMLIDCSRMAQWWNRERAQSLTKAELLAGAAAEPGLWGALEGEWNARDMEYAEGRSKCVHFTALHTQPWQPTPEQYSYHHHPLAHVWNRIERAADAQMYQVFGPERPSLDFVQAAETARGCPPDTHVLLTTSAKQWLSMLPPASVLRCSFGTPTPDPLDPVAAATCDHDYAAAPRLPEHDFDAVVAVELLEHLPIHDVPWTLDAIFARANKGVLASVVCPAGATGSAPRSPDWWRSQMAGAARRKAGPAWRLSCTARDPTAWSRHSKRRRRCPGNTPCMGVVRQQDGRQSANAQLGRRPGLALRNKESLFQFASATFRACSSMRVSQRSIERRATVWKRRGPTS